MRVTPDDEVYRVNTVWLGPSGLTFPWTARYLAYATWLVTFLVVLFVEAVTPLTVHIPPIWELCITTLFTYGVMGFVDHERPVGAVWRTFVSDLSTPRPGRRTKRTRTHPNVRVREARVKSRVDSRPGDSRRRGRPTHPSPPDRSGGPDRSGRPDRSGLSGRSDRFGLPGRSDRSGRPSRSARHGEAKRHSANAGAA